jgi:hypothetical protein
MQETFQRGEIEIMDIKDVFTKTFDERLSEEEKAVKILNVYRNFYYMEGNDSERGIIANAINTILPDYVNKILKGMK